MEDLHYHGNEKVIPAVVITMEKNIEEIIFLVGYSSLYEAERAFLDNNFVYATSFSFVEAYPGDWDIHENENGYDKIINYYPTYINVNTFKQVDEIQDLQTVAVYSQYKNLR